MDTGKGVKSILGGGWEYQGQREKLLDGANL